MTISATAVRFDEHMMWVDHCLHGPHSAYPRVDFHACYPRASARCGASESAVNGYDHRHGDALDEAYFDL